MLKNTDIKVNNLIASGTIFDKEVPLIGKVLSIGNDEQEFEQVYCECEESFEWFFKDNYCGVPILGNENILIDLGFKKYESIIEPSYSYKLEDINEYDDILKKQHIHYKEISLMFCNDKGKGEYYVFIREGTTNDRLEDSIITISREYRFIHQVQNLLDSFLIKI